MRPILLKTGSASADLRAQRGDYDRWFADGFGWALDRFHLIDATADPDYPHPRGVDGVVITGSPLSVHDRHAWSVRAGEWVVQAMAAGVPVLGVCYGHQLIADTLGGSVGLNPAGREIGVVEIEVEDDWLFTGLPRRLPAIITHCDAVNGAPEGARVLGRTPMTPIQAMALGENTRTVQWHPEFDAHIIRHIINSRAEAIDYESGPGTAARLHDAVVGVHTGPVILRNWAERFWA